MHILYAYKILPGYFQNIQVSSWGQRLLDLFEFEKKVLETNVHLHIVCHNNVVKSFLKLHFYIFTFIYLYFHEIFSIIELFLLRLYQCMVRQFVLFTHTVEVAGLFNL